MNSLTYILRRTFINYLKQLKKKPLVLAAYIFFAAFFIFIIVVSFTLDTKVNNFSNDLFGVIATSTVVFILYFSLKQGIDRGSSFFRLSDVNMIFTAPISDKTVLIYGFLKQLFSSILILLFLTFQIPNIVNNFQVEPIGVLIIFITIFLLMVTMPIVGMLLYSISSKSNDNRKILKNILNIVTAVFVAGLVLSVVKNKDFITGAQAYLNNDIVNNIPIVGWFKTMMMAAVYGVDLGFYLNLALVLVTLSVIVAIIYNIKSDYYEDVLVATEWKEEMIRLKKEGKSNIYSTTKKVKKVKSGVSGSGAKAIFHRHILEYRKVGFFLVDKMTLIIVAASIMAKFLFKGGDITYILYWSVYMLFFFMLQGKWADEIEKPFIYMLPASSISKVFFATLAQVIKTFVDGLVLFTIAGLLLHVEIAVILLSALAYTTFGTVFAYGDVLSRRVFGKKHSKNLEIFLKIFLVIVIIAPGIALSTVLRVVFDGQVFFYYMSYVALIVYNVIASFIILFCSKGIFEKYEL